MPLSVTWYAGDPGDGSGQSEVSNEVTWPVLTNQRPVLPLSVTWCAGDPGDGGGCEHPQGRGGAIEVEEAGAGPGRQLPHSPAVCPAQSEDGVKVNFNIVKLTWK